MALQSVSGTINLACWCWRARALRRYMLVPLPPHVYPTSTSRDVSDQAFHAHSCPHAQNSPAYNECLAGKAWERGYPIPIIFVYTIYNCYRTVRHEKRGIAGYPFFSSDSVSRASLSCNSCVYKDIGMGYAASCSTCFFIICHPYIPLHLEETIFYTCRIEVCGHW